MGAKVLPKLKMSERSIEYKYHEGNVKRTLKRELKVFETVTNQAISFVGLSLLLSFCFRCSDCHLLWNGFQCICDEVGLSEVWKADWVRCICAEER